MTEVRQKMRGTTAQLDAVTSVIGHLCYDTQTKNLRIYDGVTLGGIRILTLPNLLTDTAAKIYDSARLNGQAAAFYQNASNLNAGVLPNARISGSYDGVDTLTGNRIRLLSTTDASETSTAHAFQIGLYAASNVIMDANEIVSRNNGALSTFFIDSTFMYFGANEVRANGNLIWHAGNDGTGSGLDAGLLEGQLASFYRNASNLNAGTLPNARIAGNYDGIGILDAQFARLYNATGYFWVGLANGAGGRMRINPNSMQYADTTSDIGTYTLSIPYLAHSGKFTTSDASIGFGSFSNVGAPTPTDRIAGTRIDYASGYFDFFQTSIPGAPLVRASLRALNAKFFGTIDSNWSIGSTPGWMLTDSGRIYGTSSATSSLVLRRLDNDGQVAVFQREATSVGSISVTATGTTYGVTSDKRLKTDLLPIDPNLLDAIEVYDFAWILNNARSHGVMAQDVNGVVPDAVQHMVDMNDDGTQQDLWVVDYSKFVPLALAVAKDHRKKLADIESRLQALEAA